MDREMDKKRTFFMAKVSGPSSCKPYCSELFKRDITLSPPLKIIEMAIQLRNALVISEKNTDHSKLSVFDPLDEQMQDIMAIYVPSDNR